MPLDEDFTPEDPRLLVYESLGRMADRLAEFDWFINLEDDIELNEATFRNALDFERLSRPEECLLPNRMELRASGPQCIDLLALPGWTQQERSLFGRTFRVARNPHSGLLMLSRDKFAYALQSVDRSFRDRVVGGLMASAYAHYHRPLTLYRCFDDPSFHSVVHLDPYGGGLPPGARLEFSAIIPSGTHPHHLPLIVRTLRQIPQIREILVGNHDPLQTPDLPGATVVNTPRNSLCLSRYALVPLAAHDNLWLQDDDVQLQPPQPAAPRLRDVRESWPAAGRRRHCLQPFLSAQAPGGERRAPRGPGPRGRGDARSAAGARGATAGGRGPRVAPAGGAPHQASPAPRARRPVRGAADAVQEGGIALTFAPALRYSQAPR